jgi:CAAX prenyl protease-like protein
MKLRQSGQAVATSTPLTDSSAGGPREMLPYCAPMLSFLLLTSLENYLPSQSWYPLAYTLKVAMVALVAWLFRSTWNDLGAFSSVSICLLATMVGLVVFVLWVRLEGWYPVLGILGRRTGFDPSALHETWQWPFVAVRFAGLVIIVPLIEELFWRSFLVRWLVDTEFWKVPIGRVTPMAAGVSSALFATAHPEWLPALLTGLLWAWLLWETKSLSSCVLSHSVANLALGVHVLLTRDWKYW